MGNGAILEKMSIDENLKKELMYLDHAFNQYLSDIISVNRSLPDRRDDWCKQPSRYVVNVCSIPIASLFQLLRCCGPATKDVNHHLFPQRGLEHPAEVNLLSVESFSVPPCARNTPRRRCLHHGSPQGRPRCPRGANPKTPPSPTSIPARTGSDSDGRDPSR